MKIEKGPEPVTVAEWSKAWTVLDRLNAGIVGSNPTRDMDVYVHVLLFYVCVVLVLNLRARIA
jgi:hypothetical protein